MTNIDEWHKIQKKDALGGIIIFGVLAILLSFSILGITVFVRGLA